MLATALRGYLNGSIDLVLRVRGAIPPTRRDRYAIIDYKTNWLAPAGEPLAAAHYRCAAFCASRCSARTTCCRRCSTRSRCTATSAGGSRHMTLRPTSPASATCSCAACSDLIEPDSACSPGARRRELVVALSDLLAGGRAQMSAHRRAPRVEVRRAERPVSAGARAARARAAGWAQSRRGPDRRRRARCARHWGAWRA